ncbi:MAG TPA: type III-B CRISPR module RAMP protein Cmr6 [Gammaproteobacteria bacterium]|nr:type III-B CRISPR module RAMP protein Cmr6 [Gammaproteobacteria bacterium]
MNKGDQALLKSLHSRQSALLTSLPEQDSMYLPARATAPFTTGLGNEHPTENGFAFLWPYGLPYLPGSGVKGVVRQAARELAGGDWGDTHGWSNENRQTVKAGKTTLPLSDLDLLFGLESADGGKDHFRGLLTFWDVIPEITGDLAVDVMTPHQKHYYQEGKPPHDSGQPVPITFLTVPAGSTFPFHVTCDTQRMQRIAPHLLEQEEDTPRWQRLLTAAFEHAFDWLGFGAKTAVGYGAMASIGGRENLKKPKTQRQTWQRARVIYTPNNQELTATHEDLTARLQGPAVKAVLGGLSKAKQKKLKGGTEMEVEVEGRGKQWTIIEVR